MKLKKIMILSTVLTTLTSSVLPISAFASEINSSKLNKQSASIEQTLNNQKEWDKLDKYVIINTTTLQFELESSAKNDLSKDELKLVDTYMKNANKEILKVKKDKNVSISVKNDNTLNVKPKSKSNSNISVMSIDTDSYWDYDIHIWGYRVFLSRDFVDDMTSEVGNTTVYFAGASGYAVTQLLEEIGMSSGPAGWIGIAAGGKVVYSYDKIVKRCNGTGVYIDMNIFGSITSFVSIYGA